MASITTAHGPNTSVHAFLHGLENAAAHSNFTSAMEPTLLKFVWRFSRRQQLMALGIALAMFPLTYLSLEIPKIIINDALASGPDAAPIDARLADLFWLCGAFLAVVVVSGLLKMGLNLYKGAIGERLMKRLRFQLIDRMLHFPLPEFRRTSQGEVVSVVTSEVEPLGGVMSEAVAQPVFLAGQMLTILAFLFVQSVWLGLVSIAFIPLQAWLIPMLQRQLNKLQLERIREVRQLSGELGDTVAAVEDLRANNGVQRREAAFSARLMRLFDVRLRIYRKKYFMKFLNNFINQITPLLYFSVGGWLVISGELTVGALVAALAAYKDLTNPWKELLAYVNQLQDMSARYVTVVERFSPAGVAASPEAQEPRGPSALGLIRTRAAAAVSALKQRASRVATHFYSGSLLDGLRSLAAPLPLRPQPAPGRLARPAPASAPRLNGPLRLESLSIGAPGDSVMLQRVEAELPAGGLAAILGGDALSRSALAQVLARTSAPSAGRLLSGEVDLAALSETAAATRIGMVPSAPKLYEPTIWENVRSAHAAQIAAGAQACEKELSARWREIIELFGLEDELARRGLDMKLDPIADRRFATRIVGLRPRIAARLRAEGLTEVALRFDAKGFNPSMTLAENLVFAVRRPEAEARDRLDRRLLAFAEQIGVSTQLQALARDFLTVLTRTFSGAAAEHRLFARLGGVGPDLLARLRRLDEKLHRDGPAPALSDDDLILLHELLFRTPVELLGGATPKALIDRILIERQASGAVLLAETSDLFAAIEADAYIEPLTVLENALYGRLPLRSSAHTRRVREIALEVFAAEGVFPELTELAGGAEVGPNGVDLEPRMRELLALVRAVIKRPDILVFENALREHRTEERAALLHATRKLLPAATIILLDERAPQDVYVDATFLLRGDTLIPAEEAALEVEMAECADDPTACAELTERIRLLARAEALSGLKREQLRLLAYAAERIEAEAGTVLFDTGAAADGVYLLESGLAELRAPQEADELLAEQMVRPGRLVGELSVLRGSVRQADFVAVTALHGLKIGAEEFLDVVKGDPDAVMQILTAAAGRLQDATVELRAARRENAALRQSVGQGALDWEPAGAPYRGGGGGRAVRPAALPVK